MTALVRLTTLGLTAALVLVPGSAEARTATGLIAFADDGIVVIRSDGTGLPRLTRDPPGAHCRYGGS